MSFFLSLWKLNFINWLEFRLRSVAWRGCRNGIRGLFVGKHVSERLLLLTTGEDTFVFSFLGTSSLSNILEVFISSCLLLSAEDKTNVTVLALEIQGEECILGTSQMTSCSHSSAIDDVVLSSLTVRFNCGDSSSITILSIAQFGCTVTSEESCWFECSSDVASFHFGVTDLEYRPRNH